MFLIKITVILSFLSGIFIKYKILGNNIYKNINIRYLIISILLSLYSNNLLTKYTDSGIIF